MVIPEVPENSNIVAIPLTLSVIATEKNCLPCLELRRATNDKEIIKLIVTCAFNETPLLITPRFVNRMRAINSLISKGIIKREENDLSFVDY